MKADEHWMRCRCASRIWKRRAPTCSSVGGYQRPRPPSRPPPRTALSSNNKMMAPIVAFAIAATMPAPRWTPSWGNSQPPKNAPTIPIMRSPRASGVCR